MGNHDDTNTKGSIRHYLLQTHSLQINKEKKYKRWQFDSTMNLYYSMNIETPFAGFIYHLTYRTKAWFQDLSTNKTLWTMQFIFGRTTTKKLK